LQEIEYKKNNTIINKYEPNSVNFYGADCARNKKDLLKTKLFTCLFERADLLLLTEWPKYT